MKVLMDYGDEIYLAIDKNEAPGFLEEYFTEYKSIITKDRIVVILNDPIQIKQVFEFLRRCDKDVEFVLAGGKLHEQYHRPEFIPRRKSRTTIDEAKHWI